MAYERVNPTIRRVEVNQDGLKLNGVHQVLVYCESVNIVGESVLTIKKSFSRC